MSGVRERERERERKREKKRDGDKGEGLEKTNIEYLRYKMENDIERNIIQLVTQ